jgi:hypothetical protein
MFRVIFACVKNAEVRREEEFSLLGCYAMLLL